MTNPVILMRKGGIALAAPSFFAVKLSIGLILVNFSARFLSLGDFVIFSQFFLLLAFVNMIAAGGIQNGLIRQIAAKAKTGSTRTSLCASLVIWASASFLAVLLTIWFRNNVAELLAGDQRHAWVGPWLVTAGLAGGGGQIYCASLTGANRGVESLLAQTIGVLSGGILSIVALWRGEAIASVFAFSIGSIATGVVAHHFVRKANIFQGRVVISELGAEIRLLLKYSGSFFAVASLMPSALFLLRFAYREAFGLEALGQWLVANRVSDMTTQLLGIFMVQAVLPAISAATTPQLARKIMVRTFVAASAGMVAMLVIFTSMSSFMIHFFLSDQYLGAVKDIQSYMIGDIFRVVPSIALNVSLARRKLWTYIAIEAAPVIIFLLSTLLMVVLGIAAAPLIGYVGAYFAATVVLIRAFCISTPPSLGMTCLRTFIQRRG